MFKKFNLKKVMILYCLLFMLFLIPKQVSAESLIDRMELGDEVACVYDFNIKAMSNSVMSKLGINAENKNKIDFKVNVVLRFKKTSESNGGTFQLVGFFNNNITNSELSNFNDINSYFNGGKIFPIVKDNIYDLEFDHSDDHICNSLGLMEICPEDKYYQNATDVCPQIYYNPTTGFISTSLSPNYSGTSYPSDLDKSICLSYLDTEDDDDSDALLSEYNCAYVVVEKGYTHIKAEPEPEPEPEPDIEAENCHLLPEAIENYIKDALKFLRWGALALMIILGVLDFAKAIIADDQDALKKAWQKFIKRLIAVIILFLLPILIEFILYIAGLAGFVDCYPSTNY